MIKRKIIAFCGFESSGKDYSCARLMMTKGFRKFAFADALREVAFKTIGISYEEGIKNYAELKRTELINGLNFRNILENLGSAIRRYDKEFWVKTVLVKINECIDNVCISDLRYANEFIMLQEYARQHDIDFKLVFCDYHGEHYRTDNPHESATFARFLKDLGYKDQQYVLEADVRAYIAKGGK